VSASETCHEEKYEHDESHGAIAVAGAVAPRRQPSSSPGEKVMKNIKKVRFEVIMAMSMKKVIFWDLVPCNCGWNRRFGGTYHLHLQGR
jgi:hypothetical protein